MTPSIYPNHVTVYLMPGSILIAQEDLHYPTTQLEVLCPQSYLDVSR